MPKIKYYYNSESCCYEPIKKASRNILFNTLIVLLISSIIGISIFIVADVYIESPDKLVLKKENEELKLYYDLIKKDLEQSNKMMEILQERDDDIYRVVFGVDKIPEDVRTAGTGGALRYRTLLEKGLQIEQLILESVQQTDKLKKRMYIQTKSYDELLGLLKNREELLSSVPAIQPISNKELKRFTSGFGIRMHPTLKTRRMHWGVDFSINKGTPVYATGDGKVELVKSSFGGYGKQVEVHHGFGYKTKYAHLSRFIVKRGQKVKRGQLIAYSGNTGTSTAPHLHYEVIKDGRKVNPVNFFFKDLAPEEYETILRLSSIENQSMGGSD